jgi:hypothetical protein
MPLHYNSLSCYHQDLLPFDNSHAAIDSKMVMKPVKRATKKPQFGLLYPPNQQTTQNNHPVRSGGGCPANWFWFCPRRLSQNGKSALPSNWVESFGMYFLEVRMWTKVALESDSVTCLNKHLPVLLCTHGRNCQLSQSQDDGDTLSAKSLF